MMLLIDCERHSSLGCEFKRSQFESIHTSEPRAACKKHSYHFPLPFFPHATAKMTEISELEASTKRTEGDSSPTATAWENSAMTTDKDNQEHPLDNLQENIKCISSDESDCDPEEEDDFDVAGIPEPRLSSSTVPIVVEVSNAHKTARFYTNAEDPLFQGVCLYSTSSTKTTESKTTADTAPTQLFRPRPDTALSDSPESLDLWDQWYFPSFFLYLLQRGSGWQAKRRIQMDSE